MNIKTIINKNIYRSMNMKRNNLIEETDSSISWMPLREARYQYADACFAAAIRWCCYYNEYIIWNRLSLIHHIHFLYHSYSFHTPNNIVFRLHSEGEGELLRHQVRDTSIRDGADQELKRQLPAAIFNTFDRFFREKLLNPAAGWNAATLSQCNHSTRRSIEEVMIDVLSLSELSGIASIWDSQKRLPLPQADDELKYFMSYFLKIRTAMMPISLNLQMRQLDELNRIPLKLKHEYQLINGKILNGTIGRPRKPCREQECTWKTKTDKMRDKAFHDDKRNMTVEQFYAKYPRIGSMVAHVGLGMHTPGYPFIRDPSIVVDPKQEKQIHYGVVCSYEHYNGAIYYRVKWNINYGYEQKVERWVDYPEDYIDIAIRRLEASAEWTAKGPYIGASVLSSWENSEDGKIGNYEGRVIAYAPSTDDGDCALWRIFYHGDADEQDAEEAEVIHDINEYIKNILFKRKRCRKK